MFERYSEPSLRTLGFARFEASQLGSVSIETEHVLLGLFREPGALVGRICLAGHVGTEPLLLGLLGERGGTAGRSLAQKGLTVERVRMQIQDERAVSTSAPSSRPSSLDALNALERASLLLGQIDRNAGPNVRDVVEGVQLELDLVRRALNP